MTTWEQSSSTDPNVGRSGCEARTRRLRRWLLVGLLASFTTACGDYGGGGGGGGGGAPPPSATAGVNGVVGGNGNAGNGIDGVAAFSQTVFPIVRDNCVSCHAGAGPGPTRRGSRCRVSGRSP